MPAIKVTRSITVDAPVQHVRTAVENFSVWKTWSPWLYMEPEATINLHGTPGQVGHGYDWTGALVGSGTMELTSVSADNLKMDLTFLKPFKSKAKVEIDLDVVSAEQTKVSWHMDSSLPFFMFFMTATMKSMIGMDYDRGLKMLKEYIETGTINSNTEVVGIVDVEQAFYIGVEDRVSMQNIVESMSKAIPRTLEIAHENGLQPAGPIGVIYNKMDIREQRCRYTAFLPIVPASGTSDSPATWESSKTPDGAIRGQRLACRALKVVHTGKYEHLGNSWSTAMAHQRKQKLKAFKSQRPFEIYINDPAETAEEDLITEIYLPIRG